MGPDTPPEEQKIVALIGHALALQREGVLDGGTLEKINDRIHALCEGLRQQGVRVLIRGLEQEGSPLLGATDLPPDMDRTLDRTERMIYNHLRKLQGQQTSPRTLLRILEKSDKEFAVRKDKILEVLDSLSTLEAMLQNDQCALQLVRIRSDADKTTVGCQLVAKKSKTPTSSEP